MADKKTITIWMCAFALFIMFFVYFKEDLSITGQQVFDIKPAYKYGIQEDEVVRKSVQSINLFIPKRGFFRHAQCFVDDTGVGYCGWAFGPGENHCWFDAGGYSQCNHLECINQLCFRVSGKGNDTCSTVGAKC